MDAQPDKLPSYPEADDCLDGAAPFDAGLDWVARRLARTVERDALVQSTLNDVRMQLQVSRVVLYYFYRQWKGQVTCESLRNPALSIFGSTGADDCFNDDYAALYLAGRTRAVADVERAGLHPCHLEFLRTIQVRANLVTPIVTAKGLWGLLVAHDCEGPHTWSEADQRTLGKAAIALATAPSIRDH